MLELCLGATDKGSNCNMYIFTKMHQNLQFCSFCHLGNFWLKTDCTAPCSPRVERLLMVRGGKGAEPGTFDLFNQLTRWAGVKPPILGATWTGRADIFNFSGTGWQTPDRRCTCSSCRASTQSAETINLDGTLTPSDGWG